MANLSGLARIGGRALGAAKRFGSSGAARSGMSRLRSAVSGMRSRLGAAARIARARVGDTTRAFSHGASDARRGSFKYPSMAPTRYQRAAHQAGFTSQRGLSSARSKLGSARRAVASSGAAKSARSFAQGWKQAGNTANRAISNSTRRAARTGYSSGGARRLQASRLRSMRTSPEGRSMSHAWKGFRPPR